MGQISWYKTEGRYDIAKHFHKFGMLLTKICGNSENEDSYKDPSEEWDFEDQTEDFLEQIDWSDASGIGIQLGHNEYRAIDIDNVASSKKYGYFTPQEFKHRLEGEMIYTCLSMLGLPANYEWVVKSPHGYHIIFKAPEVKNMPDSIGYAPNSFFSEKDAEQISFSRIELLWRTHLVLPPSIYQNRYIGYEFTNCELPKGEPHYVKIGQIDSLLNYFCGQRSFANHVDVGYDTIHLNGAHFFMAQIKKKVCRGSMEEIADYYESQNLTLNNECAILDFTGLDSNIHWLKACATRESCNKLGIISHIVNNSSKEAQKYFKTSRSTNSLYNLACLMAINSIPGSISDMTELLSQVNIDKVYKDQLRIIYYETHENLATYILVSVTTTAPKDEYKYLRENNETPNLLELSWIMTDNELNIIRTSDHLAQPHGFMIPKNITNSGGASHDFARKYGKKDWDFTLLNLAEAMSEDSVIICHDAEFCIPIIREHLNNIDFSGWVPEITVPTKWETKEFICLKKTATPLMEEIYGCKVEPSLMDLYEFITDEEYKTSKDARYNVECIFRIYSILKSRKIQFITYRLDSEEEQIDLHF